MTYYKRVYKDSWKLKGNPRELLLYSILRLKLPKAYELQLSGFGAGSSKMMYGSDGHQPDITVLWNGQLICGIEVSGTFKPYEEIRKDGIWVLPDKIKVASSWNHSYIYTFILEAEFPTGKWLFWLPGTHLEKLKGRRVEWRRRYGKHLIPERYLSTPARAWNTGVDTLLVYIKSLSEREMEL